jgi:hypothetical protein
MITRAKYLLYFKMLVAMCDEDSLILRRVAFCDFAPVTRLTDVRAMCKHLLPCVHHTLHRIVQTSLAIMQGTNDEFFAVLESFRLRNRGFRNEGELSETLLAECCVVRAFELTTVDGAKLCGRV